MLSLCRIDAAFRRLQAYDPDLDVSLLSLDDADMTTEERREFVVHVHLIRITLVARIADIVKQAATEPSSLDAAVAMVEVLISTYTGYGQRSGCGHKQAMQAIQLLASIYNRFDEAIDLFFDLVERFCAQSRSKGTIKANAAVCADAFAIRTMQNYDQTLLKLISKHWNAVGPFGNWDIVRPLERIKDLRGVYEMRDGSRALIFSYFKRKEAGSSLFCESQKMLRKIQKRRVVEAMATDGRSWSPRSLVSRRSSPTLRMDRLSEDQICNEKQEPCVTIKELSEEWCRTLEAMENQRSIAHMDAFVDPKIEMKVLYTITENSSESCVVEIQPLPDYVDFDSKDPV